MSGVEIVTVVIALILVLVLIWVIYVVVRNRRRSADLRAHFRSEYDRTVDQSGDQRRAERDLERREAQRGKIEVQEGSTDFVAPSMPISGNTSRAASWTSRPWPWSTPISWFARFWPNVGIRQTTPDRRLTWSLSIILTSSRSTDWR